VASSADAEAVVGIAISAMTAARLHIEYFISEAPFLWDEARLGLGGDPAYRVTSRVDRRAGGKKRPARR
jgi:hypothetical protein